jgi:hypothetical protein
MNARSTPERARLREALAVVLTLVLVLATTVACRGGGSKKTSKGPREEVGALETTRRAWVGDWEGGGATLHIEPKGYLTFTKKKGGSNETYNGPIDHFEGNDILLNIVVSTVTLEVQTPPHTDPDGKARMTIEGTEVTQVWAASHAAPPKSK